MNGSTEDLVPDTKQHMQDRWSASTAATTMEPSKMSWEAPPVPPIPSDKREESWRRRSNKRCSYTSQMSGRNTYAATQPLGADSEKKQTRPVSEVSTSTTMASRPAKRSSRGVTAPMEQDMHTDLHWDIDALNPRNWSSRRKWLNTMTAAAVTFTITLASSIVTPAQQEFHGDFNITSTEATLPFALFVLGLACGPSLSRPGSEVFGHKVIYMIFFPLFAIFTLATGLVHTSYGLIICRLFAGLFASPALSVGCSALLDIWKPEERTLPSMIYYGMPLLGPATGMLLGGFVTQHLNGRWTQYIVLFASAVCVAPVVFMSETAKAIIIRRKHGGSAWVPVSSATSNTALLESVRMLCTKPAVFLLSLCSSFNLAVLYATFAAFPNVFYETYAFDLGSQGLTFVSMIIGIMLASIFIVLHYAFIYGPRVARLQEDSAIEAEKVMAARRRTNRSSHHSGVSNFSRPNYKRDTSHTSLALSLKRITTRPRTPPIVDHDKNATLAVAAADYLNGLPANEGRRILPERVQLLLNKNPAYGELCAAIEGYQLKMDRIQFAKVLVDALPTAMTSTDSPGAANPHQSALARSKSLHRSAAAAALHAPAAPVASASAEESWPFPAAPPQRSSYIEPRIATARVPHKWHLWPALPASILLVVSLSMFGWTARKGVSWVAPCFAMGMLAFSAMLTFVSTQLYIMERCGERHASSALAGGVILRYLLSFAFIMFAERMFDGLGAGWAASILGFVGLLLGAVPWILTLYDRHSTQG
ncbi:hypothetical protein LTR85_011282 [Meristemomyces frigidus]|nr:hypothetical protein LTR85_011282 [Meristemomyces frigidus]